MKNNDKQIYHPIFNYFLDDNLERRYKNRAKQNVIRMLVFSISIYTLNTALLILSDYQYVSYDEPVFNLILWVRIFLVTFSCSLIAILIFVKKRNIPDLVTFSFFMILSVQNYVVHILNDQPQNISYSVELVAVLGFYLIFPVNLKIQLIGGVIFSSANFFSLGHDYFQPETRNIMILLFISTNIMGAVVSSIYNRTTRKLFSSYLEEKELRNKIKTTTNDIKMIRGLIPICSSCKSIRDDDGFWNEVDQHLSKITNAEFIMDECPNCKSEEEHSHV